MPHSAGSLPPSKRHTRLTVVRRGCELSRIAGIHGEAMYTAPTLRSACSPVDLLRRPQAAQSPNPPQRKQNSPAPGPKPGGGAGAEGRAAAAARRPKAAGASPPTLAARSKTGERGDGGGVAPEEPTATAPKKWDGGSLPEGPPAAAAARDGAARAQGGAAEPRSGRAGFCPQRTPPSAKRGRRARLRGKADEGRGPPFRRDGAARIPKSADAIRRQHNERQRGGAGRDGAPHGSRENPPCTHSLRRELPSRGGSGGPIYRATTLPRVRHSSR